MMDDKQIRKDLAVLQQSFTVEFTGKVMGQVDNLQLGQDNMLRIWNKRILLAAAACLAFLLTSTYINYGSISSDSLMGLSGYNNVELSESFDTYINIYNE